MITPFSLQGRFVALEPLTAQHAPALAAAAAQDRSSYAFTHVPDGIADSQRYVAQALTDQVAGQTLVWAVRRHSDALVVGSTRYLDMYRLSPESPSALSDDRPPSVLEIGATWYLSSAQRSPVNTEAKLLLLGHAFDTWSVLRVSFKTDARNSRSRAAIERLGAVSEGIRRVHVLASDGALRDSAYYSILAAEWPPIRQRLRARLP